MTETARLAQVILVARRADSLAALSREVQEKYGRTVAIVAADLTDSGDLAGVGKHLAAEKRITMLVNNEAAHSNRVGCALRYRTGHAKTRRFRA